MHLQPATRVVVCDAGRYVIYENIGDRDRLDLRVSAHASIENPPARDQGNDRPGRFASPDGQRSAVDQTDRHDLAEHRFLSELADTLTRWAMAEGENCFVLVADPKSMGRLRTLLPPSVQQKILTSITGDHVHRPSAAIEDLIARI